MSRDDKIGLISLGLSFLYSIIGLVLLCIILYGVYRLFVWLGEVTGIHGVLLLIVTLVVILLCSIGASMCYDDVESFVRNKFNDRDAQREREQWLRTRPTLERYERDIMEREHRD